MPPRWELHVRRCLAALERLWVNAVRAERFQDRLEAFGFLFALYALGLGGAALGLALLTALVRASLDWLMLGTVVAVLLYFLDWLKGLLPPPR